MEKEFVPYEIAKKLKELGFDIQPISYYTDRILYQQAFRWFREKHDLIYIIDTPHSDGKWEYIIFGSRKYKYLNREENLNSYDEAELKCIGHMIELVKNRE